MYIVICYLESISLFPRVCKMSLLHDLLLNEYTHIHTSIIFFVLISIIRVCKGNQYTCNTDVAGNVGVYFQGATLFIVAISIKISLKSSTILSHRCQARHSSESNLSSLKIYIDTTRLTAACL